MTFVEPQYAWLLFTLPVFALLKVFADSRAQRAMEAFASSERLRRNLLGGASVVWSGLHFGLQLLGLCFLIIAMTRPQLGVIEKEISESGRNIFIAIDTSKSMLTEDVKPNRITRAKLAAMDLLEMLPGDRVGLIAFAGRSFLQAPLTTDHEAVRDSIQSLDHTTIPRGGSSVAAAIQLALETIEKSSTKGHHGMILFTDGQETDDATLEAARLAAEKNLLILPVGVGTTEGELIPDPESRTVSGYVTDRQGNVVHSRLESGMLREVATITHGEYVELSSQALTRDLISRLTAKLQRHEAESRQESRQAERYQWPLGAAIFCICLSLFMRPSSRKRVKAASALPVDPQASVHMPAKGSRGLASASLWWVPWLGIGFLASAVATSSYAAVDEKLVEARRAYAEGDYKKARDRFAELLDDKEHRVPREELAYSLGAAELKLGDEAKAIKAFSHSLLSRNNKLQLQSLRALGNTLFEKGKKETEAAMKSLMESKPKVAEQALNRTIKDWEDALSHLGTALQLDPGDQHTHENYDYVKRKLEELKKLLEEIKQQQKQQQQQNQQGQGQGQSDPNGKGQQEGEPQPQGENGDQDRDPKETDAMQEGEQEVPEGQLSAGDKEQQQQDGNQNQQGKQEMAQNQQQQQEAENQRNNETGFTPMEARSQLRNYADDEKSVQFLMRREMPLGGKDY